MKEQELVTLAEKIGFNRTSPIQEDGLVNPHDFYNYMCQLQRFLRTQKKIHVYPVLGVAEQYSTTVYNQNYAHGTAKSTELMDYEPSLHKGLVEACKQVLEINS